MPVVITVGEGCYTHSDWRCALITCARRDEHRRNIKYKIEQRIDCC